MCLEVSFTVLSADRQDGQGGSWAIVSHGLSGAAIASEAAEESAFASNWQSVGDTFAGCPEFLHAALCWQVALHDWRNMSQRLHVFEAHTDEVFQVRCAGRLATPGVWWKVSEATCHSVHVMWLALQRYPGAYQRPTAAVVAPAKAVLYCASLLAPQCSCLQQEKHMKCAGCLCSMS